MSRCAATAAPPVDSLVFTMRTFIQVRIVYLTKVTKNVELTKSNACFITVCRSERRLGAVVLLLGIWVEKGQRVKKTRKSDILILNIVYFAISIYHFGCVKWLCAVVVGVPQGLVDNSIALLSRACIRVRARAFQQRCCFFAVTSVTHGEKVGGKTPIWGAIQAKKALFLFLLQHIFLD